MSGSKAKARPQRAPREQHVKVRMKEGHVLAILRPESTPEDRQTLLRRLQKARAVAKAIAVAIDYSDEDLDVGDAVGGLVALLEDAIAGLDPPGSAP